MSLYPIAGDVFAFKPRLGDGRGEPIEATVFDVRPPMLNYRAGANDSRGRDVTIEEFQRFSEFVRPSPMRTASRTDPPPQDELAEAAEPIGEAPRGDD